MRLVLIAAAALTISLAPPVQARDSGPVQFKVSGFVRSTCRIEIRRIDLVVEPGCNIPWKVLVVPPEQAEGGKVLSGKAPISRVTVSPAV